MLKTNAFFRCDLQVWRSCTPLRQFSVSTAGRSSSAPPKSELASDLLATLERRGVPWNLLFRMPSHELGELVVRTGQSGVREIVVVHVGCTKCWLYSLTSSTDHTMKKTGSDHLAC